MERNPASFDDNPASLFSNPAKLKNNPANAAMGDGEIGVSGVENPGEAYKIELFG
jgi:hypothetical protein